MEFRKPNLSRIDRRRLFEIIEPGEPGDKASKIYDNVMLTAIICSLIPLVYHKPSPLLTGLDIAACVLFIFDYLARWYCAALGSKRQGKEAFIFYPITPMAVIDLLSILPTLVLFSPVFKVLRVSRLFKLLRLFRALRYYEPIVMLASVIKKEARTLATVVLFAIVYIFVCALVMYNIEANPGFHDFWDALYWSCSTLTTVGYGDIYPVTDIGRTFSMISALVGIALIALPSCIITTGYIEELRERRENKERNLTEKDPTEDA